jgi:bifunctional DNA-binding transcriptional regulator/antitoxin component of YhaV-PrlF toxin-antitoxin module
MKSSVITSMDESGHLVVPQEVRREAGLKPGMLLRISSREGRVEIEPVTSSEGEPAPQQVRIVPKGKLWVVEPIEPGEPLTAEVVRQTQDWIRDRGLED